MKKMKTIVFHFVKPEFYTHRFINAFQHITSFSSFCACAKCGYVI